MVIKVRVVLPLGKGALPGKGMTEPLGVLQMFLYLDRDKVVEEY